MGAGCTAVSATQYYPDLNSGQINGLIGGLKGAAEYEFLRDPNLEGTDNQALAGMTAQSVVHVLIILLVSIFIYRRRYRSEESPGMGRTPNPKKPAPSRPSLEPALTFDGGGSVRSGSIDDMSIETSNIDEDIYPGREPDLEDILEIATSMSRFTDFVASKREMVKKARKGYVDGSIPRDIYIEVKRLLEE